MKLYGYWRSSASWRVRWALELKGIVFENIPVNLLNREHKSEEHMKRNPGGLVPSLELSPGKFLNQSVAILEYLDEINPQSYRLYPGDAYNRAFIRSLCEIINSDTAALQAPRTQNYYAQEPEAKKKWAQHFIGEGLQAYANQSDASRGLFSVGDYVTAADLFLVPQVYNAYRYGIDVAQEFPALDRIYQNAMKTSECFKAAPEQQVDAIKS